MSSGIAAEHSGRHRPGRRSPRVLREGGAMAVAHSILPFTALIGQESMKQALVLNAVNPTIGGVLIRGEKGTAKSTAVRALARPLPDIEVVADCPYAWPPDQTAVHCTDLRFRVVARETTATE